MNGHLQPRGRNTWRYHFSIDGQRCVETLHGNRREAERQAARLYAATLDARPKAPARWTVGDLLRAWLRDKLPTVRTDRTRFLYRYSVEHYWLPAIGELPLREYRSHHLLEVKSDWLGRLSTNTVRHQFERLAQAEKWALKHGYLAESPAALVELPSQTASTARRYSLADALKLDAVLEPPYGLAVALGLWAGLRIGEVRGVQKGDIEASGLLTVRRQLARYQGVRDAFLPPKRGSERVVEINARLERHLVSQLDWLEARKVRRLDDLLCVTLHGTPLPNKGLYAYLHEAQARAEVALLGFHSLRHTYATLLREALVPDLEISASLGHRSTQQLVRLYGNHPDEERQRRMARAMDALVSAATLPEALPKQAEREAI